MKQSDAFNVQSTTKSPKYFHLFTTLHVPQWMSVNVISVLTRPHQLTQQFENRHDIQNTTLKLK